MTTRWLVLRILAVVVILIVTGSEPQSNVMMPPAATAATTARDVQLAGVPLPTTRDGREVSTARPSTGTATWPSGLPGGRAAPTAGTAAASAATMPLTPRGNRTDRWYLPCRTFNEPSTVVTGATTR